MWSEGVDHWCVFRLNVSCAATVAESRTLAADTQGGLRLSALYQGALELCQGDAGATRLGSIGFRLFRLRS